MIFSNPMNKSAPFSALLLMYALPAVMLLFTGLETAAQTISLKPYERSVNVTGFTRAKHTMTISSEVAGRCLEVYADKGDSIPASGKLATLDDTFIVLELDANRVAQQKIKRQLENEVKTLERYTMLHGQKSVPQATLDEVRLNAELHRLDLLALDNAHRRLDERRQRFSLTAPPGWQILERMVEPGEYVQPGQPIAHLGEYRELLIPLALSFSELESLRALEQIRVTLPDIDFEVTAQIFRVSPGFDPTTRKIPVDLIIPGNQRQGSPPLRGGMRAVIKFAIEEKTDVFIIPSSALISRYDSHWVSTPDKKRIRVVLVGVDDEQAIISSDELRIGDQILIRP